jgi:hypothetical protein
VSYDVVKPDWYRIHTPDSPWHAGAQGWSQAPWPGWGENPNLIGPRMLAVNGFGSEMSVRPTTPTQRMALPGMPMPTVAPTPTAPTEKKIPWALIALAALVAVGGYFMLKPARGSAVKSNGKMFANGKKRRRVRRNESAATATRPKFTDWLEGRLGTRRWVVSRPGARLRERYDLFLSQKKFRALEDEYEAKFGAHPWRRNGRKRRARRNAGSLNIRRPHTGKRWVFPT